MKYVFALMTIICLSAVAQAHDFPDHASPPVGSKVPTPPAEVKIWFNDDVVVSGSFIKVTDPAGHRVDKSDSKVDDKDATLMMVTIDAHAAGTYEVHWQALCNEGHTTQGDFKFTVASPSTTTSPSTRP